jgi:hypothetical protein
MDFLTKKDQRYYITDGEKKTTRQTNNESYEQWHDQDPATMAIACS